MGIRKQAIGTRLDGEALKDTESQRRITQLELRKGTGRQRDRRMMAHVGTEVG
jgi:hypothetical protein